jgi:hypothetical protein
LFPSPTAPKLAKRAVAKKKPAYKPWKQASATGKLLVKLIEDGIIDLHDTPKTVWLSNRAMAYKCSPDADIDFKVVKLS